MGTRLITSIVVIFIVSLLLIGCNSSGTSNSNQANNYKDISADQLSSMMETNKNLLVVDVREQAEYDQGHISGALLLPTSEIESRVKELPKDKTIALVCASGARSSQAAAYLISLGYQDVYNLSGGLSSWPNELVK